MGYNHVEHNGSGYPDPTIDAVIKMEKAEEKKHIENKKYRTMAKNIKHIIESNGYRLETPISLINQDSGRKRRIY